MLAIFNRPPLWTRWAYLVRGLDRSLLLAAGLLSLIGMVTMYSSGYAHGERFVDHGRNLLLAGGTMLLLAQVPPQRLMTWAVPVYLLGVLLLLAVAWFGITKKGATRWLDLGVVVLQPSELLKIGVPLMLAWWFQRREGQIRGLDFLAATALLAVPVGLIFAQPDLGTAVLVLLSGLFVLYFAGLSWRWVIPPLVLGVAGIGVLGFFSTQLCADGMSWPMLHNYQQQRVCTLFDPMRDPLGKGFHVLQGLIAIGSGGWVGKGFMQGSQTHLDFIPERTTDFIFAAYSEEFGYLGVLVLVLVYLFLVWRCLAIAASGVTLFARLLAGSLSLIIFTYAVVNMGMVSGVLPVVGVPLPLVSYGGTAMVTLGVALGILLSVARTRATNR